MFIMFCDNKGMFLFHAVPREASVNAAYESKVCLLTLITIE